MNESFKTDPSLATSARAAKESGSYLCASNVTPTAVRFIVSVFLCLLCSCRMPSTQMTCSHFRKNRPKKRQKPAGCRSRIISKNRPVPIFGRSTGASLAEIQKYLCPYGVTFNIVQDEFFWKQWVTFKKKAADNRSDLNRIQAESFPDLRYSRVLSQDPDYII